MLNVLPIPSVHLIMAIVECESNFVEDAYNPKTYDYGYFQINKLHIPEAERLGLDITKPVDNILFGMILFNREGIKPWSASLKCIGNYSPA